MKPITMAWVACELALLQSLQVDSLNTSVELQSTSKCIGSDKSINITTSGCNVYADVVPCQFLISVRASGASCRQIDTTPLQKWKSSPSRGLMRPYIKGTALIAVLLVDKLTKHAANKINEMNEKMKAMKKILDRFLSAQEEPQLPITLQKQFSLQKAAYHIIAEGK